MSEVIVKKEYLERVIALFKETLKRLHESENNVARLQKRIELAGGYHNRTKREIELDDMLAAFPESERDGADVAIADLLILVDAGRNRLHEAEVKAEQLAARVAELESALRERNEIREP